MSAFGTGSARAVRLRVERQDEPLAVDEPSHCSRESSAQPPPILVNGRTEYEQLGRTTLAP